MIAPPDARLYPERVNSIMRSGPALVALGVLAACSSGSGTPPGTTTVTTTVRTTGSTATMSPPHIVATPPEGTPTTSTGRVLRCDGPTLAVSAGDGDAAAGTIHFRIVFTNRSSASCYLQGFPGVAAADAGGASKVNATRDTSTTATRVVLAAGRSAHADLAVRNVPPSSSACPSYPLLLVTPPDSRRTSTIPRIVQPCADQMRVTVVQPGSS
jgi:uncharacterized protein DUF4232